MIIQIIMFVATWFIVGFFSSRYLTSNEYTKDITMSDLPEFIGFTITGYITFIFVILFLIHKYYDKRKRHVIFKTKMEKE